MLAGLALGKWAPSAVQALRSMELGKGSQVNVPIAVLIWLMIIPMMMKVDFGAILNVRQRPRGLLVTLFVNWLVKAILNGSDRLGILPPRIQRMDSLSSR
jgi:ACR3 family arsenite transporter